MNLENLCIWLVATSYCCFAANVPNNPSSYTLTVDVLSSILSFTACTTLQAFLARQPQQSILGGLCIQFLVTIEVGIIQIITLSLLTNVANGSLNSFYSDYPEIAKYVMNNLPVGCCICGYLLLLSAARFVLIASPDYYQSINQQICLKLSVTFIIVVIILDLMLNHVRCLVTHSTNYSTMSILHTRIEFGILNQSMSNSTWNSLSEESECFEFLIPTALLIVSSLLEVIKVVIYSVRLFRRVKYAAQRTKTPATKVVDLYDIDEGKGNSNRSLPFNDVRIVRAKKQKLYLQQAVVENSTDIEMQTTLFKTSLTEYVGDDTDKECRLSCNQENPVESSTNIKTRANHYNILETSSTKDERIEEIKKCKLSLKRATVRNSMDNALQIHLADIQKTPSTDRIISLANNNLYCEQEASVESSTDIQTQSNLSYIKGTSLPTERVIKTTKRTLSLQEVTVIRSMDNELQAKLSKIPKTLLIQDLRVNELKKHSLSFKREAINSSMGNNELLTNISDIQDAPLTEDVRVKKTKNHILSLQGEVVETSSISNEILFKSFYIKESPSAKEVRSQNENKALALLTRKRNY